MFPYNLKSPFPDGCPVDGILWKDNCYIISNFRECRGRAQNHCEARGMDLVSVESQEENYMLLWMIQQHAEGIMSKEAAWEFKFIVWIT